MPNPYRLAYNIEPVLYAIELTPSIEKFTFEGTETLSFKAKKAFSSITLHALDLKISKGVLNDGQTLVSPKKISFDKKFETVTFHFPKKIKPSNHLRLTLHFKGELNDKMHGFYRTSFKINGQTRWGAATQFEATDARRCFPCLDEPDRKAKFDVILNVPQNLTALSNMPIVKEEKIKGTTKKKIFYATTPIMPTYLLAVVIAELECVEAKDKNGVTIRVWTTPGKKEQGLFGLDVACQALPYFAEWFDIPYALPKMDMVALPDFASGAMENWGLVTYRETALLVDKKNSSSSAKQRVAEVIDHELAHQWFGNLVTMEWWTDLWLNEGFASYMGPKAVDNQFPEWDLWTQYVVMEFLTALHDDSLMNTHPIEIDVKNPHEIREIFDHITYSKGSVVNRMLEHYLGETIFQKGLRVYLKKYAYKNAKTQDLWDALEKVSGKPVKAIMASFTKKGGYPLIRVKTKQAAGKKVVELSQERFLFDGKKDKENLHWNIPIGVSAQGMQNPHFDVMNKRKMTISLPLPENGWIKLNPGQSGFYRVAYEEKMLESLVGALRSGVFKGKAIEYLGVADDALALARAGATKTSECLEILVALKDQADYNIWTTLISALRTIESLLTDRNDIEKFSKFSRELIKPVFVKMGWEENEKNSHSDILLRSLLIASLGHFGDEEVVREGMKRFETVTDVKPNIRYAVYSIAASHGGLTELARLLDIYKKTDLQEEKVRILRALTRFKDKASIQEILAFALSKEVRNQDTYVVLAGFGSNPSARQANWLFVKKNWKALLGRYKGSSVGLLGHILEGSASSFSTNEQLSDVKKFFAGNPVQGTERTRKQTLEFIASNSGWRRRSTSDIKDYLHAKR